MTMDQARTAVREALSQIAPEAAEMTLEADRPLREQLDLDSIDAVRFLTVLSKQTGVEIPASIAGQLDTLERCALFLAQSHPHEEAAAQEHLH